MKALASASLLASFALFLAQIFLYTKDQEILVYGVFGALWYMALYFSAFGVRARTSLAGILLLSGLAAFGLGFVPHRLRLGGGFDVYVALFPTIHFFTTFAFLSARQKVTS